MELVINIMVPSGSKTMIITLFNKDPYQTYEHSSEKQSSNIYYIQARLYLNDVHY